MTPSAASYCGNAAFVVVSRRVTVAVRPLQPLSPTSSDHWTTIVCGGRTDSLTDWDGATGAVSARLAGAVATNVVPKTARLATSRADPGRHDMRTPTLEVDLEGGVCHVFGRTVSGYCGL